MERHNYIIYEEYLGINFNGYPLDYLDLDDIKDITTKLLDSRGLRCHKNKKYSLKVVVEEVKD